MQQHKIVASPQISGLVSSSETSNIHILPQATADVQTKQLVQIAQSGSQPQLVQVIQPSGEQKPILQLAQGQQLLQMNANSDKPQLVQISHPSGQQQIIQITQSGQQQLLQVCPAPPQNSQGQPIIQLCSVKQEQPVQTPDNLTPQSVVLSSQCGQTQQVIMTPALQQQLLSQIPQSVQQQLLQATQTAQPRTVISQQILPDESANVSPQTIPITTSESGQQFAIVSQNQLRQLMQEQSKIVQQPPTIVPQLVSSNMPTNSAAAVKPESVVLSPAVSVITSTASVSANSKPFQSRINGVRNFTPMNVVIVSIFFNFLATREFEFIVTLRLIFHSQLQDEDRNETAAELTTDEKMMNSPDLPSVSNSSDNTDLLKQAMLNHASKVIVENHAVPATIGNAFVPGATNANNIGVKNKKLNDLEAELTESSSSSQSLPVLSIKDAETNLPSCKSLGRDRRNAPYVFLIFEIDLETSISGEATNEDSTGMFEDFIINGKCNSIPSNIISEDSLLNNILLRDDFVADVPSGNLIAANNSTTGESNGTAVSDTVDRAVPTTNDAHVEINSIVKKESAETQTIITQDLVKNEIKVEEKPLASKNLMLAELLEKNSEKKEPPILNGALRLGEKGLELISKDEIQRTYGAINDKSVIC